MENKSGTINGLTREDWNFVFHIVDSVYEDVAVMFEGTRTHSDEDIKKYIKDNVQAIYGRRKRWHHTELSKEEVYDEVIKELFGEKHDK